MRAVGDSANIGFFYTSACPLQCDFCCHTPEVVGPGEFDPARLADIIGDFARQGAVQRFFFSGGDPFVRIGEIRSIIEDCRRAGVAQPIHLVTAGYWARSDAATARLLEPLHALGVELHVSYDTEHARFVPADNIHRIAAACRRLGMTLKIFGTFWHQDERLEDLLPAYPGVITGSTLVAPIGAARAKFHGRRYELPDHCKVSCGGAGVYDIGVYPDGTAYACCSGGFNKEGGLVCGNVFEDDAARVLEHAFRFFHVRIAKEIGFDKLYERVRAARPDLTPRLRKFSDVDCVCEVCSAIHGSPALLAELSNIYEEMKETHHG